ncbi:MAG: rhomboid family intramembrane serine protease [Chitinophagales bacterium]
MRNINLVPSKSNEIRSISDGLVGGFLHADQMHLFFNMFTLYFTKDFLASIFKPWEIIIFYLVAIAVSGVPDFIKNKDNPYYAAIGASGAVSAALFSLLLFNPWGIVYVFFFIPLPFVVFALLYHYYSYYMSKKNYDNIGHMAHFTGAIFGMLVVALKYPESLLTFIYSIAHPPSIGQMFGF